MKKGCLILNQSTQNIKNLEMIIILFNKYDEKIEERFYINF